MISKEQLKQWRESGREFLAMGMMPESVKEDERTVDCLWFSGADVSRVDWWTGEQYMLAFDPAGADLSLLNNGAPVLDDHSKWDGCAGQMGKVERAWEDGGKYYATLRFSKRPECDGMWTDIRDGILTKFSMGVELLETTEQRDKAGKLVLKTATKWRPFELSVTPIPADFNTTTLASEASYVVRASAQQEQTMANPIDNAGAQARTETAAPAVVNAEALRQAEDAERARVSEIHKLGVDFKLGDDYVQAAIDGKKTVAEVKDHALEKMRKASETDPIQHQRAELTRDERATRRELMSAVLLNRLAPSKHKLDGANEFRGYSMLEMARECLERAGVRHKGMSPMELATRVLETPSATLIGSEGVERLGMMTTSDFPYILANVANKFMLGAYAEYPAQWRQLAFQRNARDFKTQYPTLVSAAEVFELQGEAGQYKYGKLTESRESYAVKTYGKAYLFSRQMLINDDLNVFQDMSAAQGRAAARTESNIFWALITANALMADGVAVFDAGHSNLINPGTAISVDNLGIARKTLRVQTGLASEKLELTPKFLIVPVGKEQLALQYTATLPALNDASKVNPWQNTLTVIAEPRLDDSSATAWYIACAPNDHPSIVFSYLDGQEGVYQESRLGFNPEGLEFKARIDFAAAWASHRGWVKNLGAA